VDVLQGIGLLWPRSDQQFAAALVADAALGAVAIELVATAYAQMCLERTRGVIPCVAGFVERADFYQIVRPSGSG
jgi:hypothetical protein